MVINTMRTVKVSKLMTKTLIVSKENNESKQVEITLIVLDQQIYENIN